MTRASLPPAARGVHGGVAPAACARKSAQNRRGRVWAHEVSSTARAEGGTPPWVGACAYPAPAEPAMARADGVGPNTARAGAAGPAASRVGGASALPPRAGRGDPDAPGTAPTRERATAAARGARA